MTKIIDSSYENSDKEKANSGIRTINCTPPPPNWNLIHFASHVETDSSISEINSSNTLSLTEQMDSLRTTVK